MVPLRLPESTDVAILGAGPVGLDAALAIAALGRDFVLLEAGEMPAAGVRSWGDVKLFTPWELNLSARMRACLAGQEIAPLLEGNECPTGNEFCALALDPVASAKEIAPHFFTSARVVAIARDGLLKSEEIGTQERAARDFRLLLDTDHGEHLMHARVILDCTGSLHRPHPLGEGGIPAAGERDFERWDPRLLRSLPEFLAVESWQGHRVLLLGGGHSAQTAAVRMADDGASVLWALRRDGRSLEPIPADPLPERARLQERALSFVVGKHPSLRALTSSTVESLRSEATVESAEGGGGHARDSALAGPIRVELRHRDTHGQVTHSEHEVDLIVALVGASGDQTLYRELQVQECYATAGPMRLAAALLGETDASTDCLAQTSQGGDSLVTPEPGYFILGSKSYGRNNTFLLRIGYQQVADVVELLR